MSRRPAVAGSLEAIQLVPSKCSAVGMTPPSLVSADDAAQTSVSLLAQIVSSRRCSPTARGGVRSCQAPARKRSTKAARIGLAPGEQSPPAQTASALVPQMSWSNATQPPAANRLPSGLQVYDSVHAAPSQWTRSAA